MKFIPSLKSLISLFSDIELDYENIASCLDKNYFYEEKTDDYKISITKMNPNEMKIMFIENADILIANIQSTALIRSYIEGIMDLADINSSISFNYLPFKNNSYDSLQGIIKSKNQNVVGTMNNSIISLADSSDSIIDIYGILKNTTLFNINFNLIPCVLSYNDSNNYFSILQNSNYENIDLEQLNHIRDVLGSKIFNKCANAALSKSILENLQIPSKSELKK